MLVTVGLIALFWDRGATMTPEHLSRMGRFTSDVSGRVTFRSKWLDVHTRDVSKNWTNAFFFVKNDWGLIEKWGKMKDLPSPLHVSEEDIMRVLKVPDIDHLLFEVRHKSKYTEEEFLFKESQATITRLLKDQKVSEEKIVSLEAKDKKSQAIIAEKEAALTGSEPSRVIEYFKNFIAFKTILQDHVEEARDHIYEIEVKGLEQQCTEDGFIRGF
ncbi:hypothetical protein MA16_Dca021811 [Dendrobium catenatum]|uniref:Uncharacterized protein n=1 Tax=Dendrobium catenatum TaxID=906689 RepID=A0A2I0VPJ1_9ASPA|nr:hypothetical protein MA16_Dca021811 [Dendrobium catenatum]